MVSSNIGGDAPPPCPGIDRYLQPPWDLEKVDVQADPAAEPWKADTAG